MFTGIPDEPVSLVPSRCVLTRFSLSERTCHRLYQQNQHRPNTYAEASVLQPERRVGLVKHLFDDAVVGYSQSG